ncbi:MAG: recombinase family protein [Planctomycetota bacterium]|jgi:DNA invertase Pin-like site-specific DNA recombinase
MWWKKTTVKTTSKAITYYRHSAQDRQEYSIPIQREQLKKFADANGIKIIKEFSDHGVSGLSSKGRDKFLEMLEYVAEGKEDFEYILVLDMSRWGRFQDLVLSPYYIGLCQQFGKKVIFADIGIPKEDDLTHFLRLNVESYRAASYSKELSGKVFNGCVNIARHGFRAGGTTPYGLNRVLLDEDKKRVQILKRGQRKSIQNQRVTLEPGEKNEVAIVRRIFHNFVEKRKLPKNIAEVLNNEGAPSPAYKKWTSDSIISILNNELYIGTMVYNKTAQKLQSKTTYNPKEQWVRKENAFKAIVEKEIFHQAQAILRAREMERLQRYSDEDMLLKLKKLYKKYGIVSARQIAASKKMTSAATYSKHFLSLDMAFQNMFPNVLEQTKRNVAKQLSSKAKQIEQFEDYFVLNDRLSVLVQPSVPVPYGYGVYWSFRPDPRTEIDITLGVPLSNSGRYGILGYFVFPRLLVESRSIKVFGSSDSQLDLYGYNNLDIIESVLS